MFHFFAMLSRMKHIDRWGLMRATKKENLSEHSLETAYIAHALVLLHNTRFGGHADAQRAAVLAMYHDCTEILTGDLPTPVKYHNPQLRAAYAQMESLAADKLCSMLPPDLQPTYRAIISFAQPGDEELHPFIKAADKISAIIKCVEEKQTGNHEFSGAEQTLRQSLQEMHLPEAELFLREFLPSFCLNLDELKNT